MFRQENITFWSYSKGGLNKCLIGKEGFRVAAKLYFTLNNQKFILERSRIVERSATLNTTLHVANTSLEVR